MFGLVLPGGLLAAGACVGCTPDYVAAAPQRALEAAPASTSTVDVDELLVVFDAAWSAMKNAGAISEMDDADWTALRDEHRPKVLVATNENDMRNAIRAMIADLERSHFALIPREAAEMDDELVKEGATATSGNVGIDVRIVDGDARIIAVEEDSAASDSGLPAGSKIVQVGRHKLKDFTSRFGDIEDSSMAGYTRNATLAKVVAVDPGEEITIVVEAADGSQTTHTLMARETTSQRVKFGNLPSLQLNTDWQVLDRDSITSLGAQLPENTPDDFKVGVLSFDVWMLPIMQPVASAVERFRNEKVDAVIIDLRGNPGGIGGLAMGVGGHFTTKPTDLGTMYNSFGEMHFNTNPQRVNVSGELVEPLTLPLAILVDEMSASTSEIFAGGMQDQGRAIIVGRRTPGLALPAVAKKLPNGDVLYHAIAEFKLPSGKPVEGIGIWPDLEVILNANAFATTSDPDLKAALEWAAKQ